MFSVGRLCVKISGREAGRKCAIVNVIDDSLVLIDGNVRRRRCNVRHLEPLKDTIEIKKDASHGEVEAEFKKLNIYSKPRKVTRRKKTVAVAENQKKSTGKKEKPEK